MKTDSMIRTNFYLPEKLRERLFKKAEIDGESAATIARRAIIEYLKSDKSRCENE